MKNKKYGYTAVSFKTYYSDNFEKMSEYINKHSIKYYTVLENMNKIFKLLYVYQRMYNLMSLYYHSKEWHYYNIMTYEAEKDSDSFKKEKYIYMTIGILELYGLYGPKFRSTNLIELVDGKMIKVETFHNAFQKLTKLVMGVIKGNHEMTKKDMNDCNYLDKLLKTTVFEESNLNLVLYNEYTDLNIIK